MTMFVVAVNDVVSIASIYSFYWHMHFSITEQIHDPCRNVTSKQEIDNEI